LADIPAGWELCSDLLDVYLIGAAVGVEPGAVGGAHSLALTVAQLPTHTHTGTTGSAGSHNHSYLKPSAANESKTGTDWFKANKLTDTTDSDGVHIHSATVANAGSGTAIDNRPSSRGLALIIKL